MKKDYKQLIALAIVAIIALSIFGVGYSIIGAPTVFTRDATNLVNLKNTNLAINESIEISITSGKNRSDVQGSMRIVGGTDYSQPLKFKQYSAILPNRAKAYIDGNPVVLQSTYNSTCIQVWNFQDNPSNSMIAYEPFCGLFKQVQTNVVAIPDISMLTYNAQMPIEVGYKIAEYKIAQGLAPGNHTLEIIWRGLNDYGGSNYDYSLGCEPGPQCSLAKYDGEFYYKKVFTIQDSSTVTASQTSTPAAPVQTTTLVVSQPVTTQPVQQAQATNPLILGAIGIVVFIGLIYGIKMVSKK